MLYLNEKHDKRLKKKIYKELCNVFLKSISQSTFDEDIPSIECIINLLLQLDPPAIISYYIRERLLPIVLVSEFTRNAILIDTWNL